MSKPVARIPSTGPWGAAAAAATMLVMNSATPQVRRLVLVPATASGRGDELVRRYRLAKLRLAGREAARAERVHPPARST
jgi:hypothetical protein